MRHAPDSTFGAWRGLVLAISALAASGCVNKGKGGDNLLAAIPHGVGDADFVCQQELPFDSIYLPDWPLAHGMSAEEQRNQHYQKCMARLGHPEATVAPPP